MILRWRGGAFVLTLIVSAPGIKSSSAVEPPEAGSSSQPVLDLLEVKGQGDRGLHGFAGEGSYEPYHAAEYRRTAGPCTAAQTGI